MKYLLALPLVLNLVCLFLGTDYLQSVLLVFGTMSITLLSLAKYNFQTKDWKLFLGFILFSNTATIGLEVLMMKFDVWGFTNRTYNLSGILFLSAPIEEYVYWFFCPVIVVLSYLLYSKGETKGKAFFSYPLMKLFSKLKLKGKDQINYVDSNRGRYIRDKKYPVYIYVQLTIILSILLMLKFFKGCWKPVYLTTILFFFTAFPNELYSIHQGYWAYNSNRMIGLYILNIPIEGWMMYFIAPVCASMLLNIIGRKVK